MERVDLTSLMNAGVLMAANEAFFWPLGLALTWIYSHETGVASGLYISQWVYPDGHHESIELEPDDEIGDERRRRFADWLNDRLASMPTDEARAAAVQMALALNLGPERKP